MSDQEVIEDGFYIERPTDPASLLADSVIDRQFFAGETVVTPLPEASWIEYQELGLPGGPGPAGPAGTPNYLILGLPGGPSTIPDDNPPAVVYQVQT